MPPKRNKVPEDFVPRRGRSKQEPGLLDEKPIISPADTKVEAAKKTSKKDKSENHIKEASVEIKPKVSKAKSEPKKTTEKNKPDKQIEQAEPSKTRNASVLNSDVDTDAPAQKKIKIAKSATLKIISWNVGGIRALAKKDGFQYLTEEDADIVCLQEVRCKSEEVPEEFVSAPGYHKYWVDSKSKAGYAGCAIWTKEEPLNVNYGIEDKVQDEEGRAITAEFPEFYLICTYVPNAGRKLVTMPKRLDWNAAFLKYVQKLDSKKPVIIAGDMNVSHQEIDLARPKNNHKNAGFTQEERDGMTEFLKAGYVDTFRHFYPDLPDQYTFWSYFANSRQKNIGWRLDYFIVSKRHVDNVSDSVIRSEVLGSDHCPIVLVLKR